MNLLLHTLSRFPKGFFFDETGNVFAEITFSSSSGLIDVLSQEKAFFDTQNIFYVSGPAGFTGLRNLSVFLQIVQLFSPNPYSFFSIPTAQFLSLAFPESTHVILPIGKRESFLFCAGKYKKYRNEELLENSAPQFSEEIHFSNTFFQQIIEQKKAFQIEKIEIEYGAEPNIGIKD